MAGRKSAHPRYAELQPNLTNLASPRESSFYLTFFTIAALLPFRLHAQEPAITPAARAIHDSAIVIDAHADTPFRMFHENYEIGSTDPRDSEFISLDRAHAGNLSAVFFSIFVIPHPGENSTPPPLLQSSTLFIFRPPAIRSYDDGVLRRRHRTRHAQHNSPL